jgi:hypothetical protein
MPLDRLHFNTGNFILAFCTLFIPESILDNLKPNITASLLLIVISAVGLFSFRRTINVKILRTGYCILLLAIVPVLATTGFKLVVKDSDPANLLSSPSHRIYLASIGAALLGGGFLRSIEVLLGNLFPKAATVAIVLLLAGVVTGDAFLVRERDALWQSVGDLHRKGFEGLLDYRGQVGEGCQIGLVRFIGSSGFLTPMIKVRFNVNDVKFINPLTLGMIYDLEILGKAEKSFLFVYGRDGLVYDKSRLFRHQLLLNRMAILNRDHPEYVLECRAIAAQLNWEIEQLIE